MLGTALIALVLAVVKAGLFRVSRDCPDPAGLLSGVQNLLDRLEGNTEQIGYRYK